MDTIISNGKIFVADSEERGRGIFAAANILEGEIIETCPMLVVKPADIAFIDKTDLYNYYFLWGDDHDHAAIALGFGSLYNHSTTPNAYYAMDFEEKSMLIIALKPIAPMEEIFFNYNGSPTDQSEVWFEVK